MEYTEWKARKPADGNGYWYIESEGNIGQIAVLYVAQDDEMLEANAHLVAAAPKLHKELTALMQRFRTAAIMANLSLDHIDDELEGASEALAKAGDKDG